MGDRTKKILKELENIRLDLFRSAANLDAVISFIENDNHHKDDKNKYLRFLFMNYGAYRGKYKDALGNLDEKEDQVWESLIKSVSKEES